MIRHPVCRYYAKALLQTAGNIEEAQKFRDQLMVCNSVFQENQNLFSALQSTWVRFRDKENMLQDLAGRMNLEEKIARFLRIVVKNRRIDIFGSILDIFGEMLDEMLNIKRVNVISPAAMSEEDAEYVKSRLTEFSGMDIKVENTVDPEVLGGIKLVLDGKVYDNSISSKLNSIRKSFLEA